MSLKKQIRYSSFMPRLFASLIDLIFLNIITQPINQYLLVNKASFLPIFTINIILSFCYFLGFWRYYSASPGKMLLGMKIVRADDFTKPSNLQLIKRLLGYVFFVFGIWSIHFTKQKQALHDRIAGVIVIAK